MIRQKALFLSTVMTFFIIGIIAGVVRASSSNVPPTPTPVIETSNTTQEISARDAQINQTIAEANQRLENANQTIQQLQEQLVQQQSLLENSQQNGNAANASSATEITPEEALQIAQTAANGWAHPISETPELVNYQEQDAYEIKFLEGGNIYINATNGEVLYNSLTGTAGNVISEQDALNIAVNYLKGGGVYRVDRTEFNGQPAYRVIFDVGHRIYVSLGGDILYVELYKVVASSGGGSGAPAAAPSHHEEGEHEHEDDD